MARRAGRRQVFHNAIRKYGQAGFSWGVLFAGRADLSMLERFWIVTLGTLRPHGYNMTEGGEGTRGFVYSESARAQMSERMRRVWEDPVARAKIMAAQKNVPKTAEHRAKIGAGNRGQVRQPLSEEHRAKIGKGQIGRKHSEETKAKIAAGNRGKTVSGETRRRISEAKQGFRHTEESKAAISATLTGRKRTDAQRAKMVGRKHSAETKAKMSESAKRRWASGRGDRAGRMLDLRLES